MFNEMMACSGGGGTTLGALELFYPVGGTSGTTTQHNNPCTAPAFTKNYSVIVVVTRCTQGQDFSSYLQINDQASTEKGYLNLSYSSYTNYISYAVFKNVKVGDVFKFTASSGVGNTILFCIP